MDPWVFDPLVVDWLVFPASAEGLRASLRVLNSLPEAPRPMHLATSMALALVFLSPPSMGMDRFFLGSEEIYFPLAISEGPLVPHLNSNLLFLGYPSAATDPLVSSGTRLSRQRQELRAA